MTHLLLTIDTKKLRLHAKQIEARERCTYTFNKVLNIYCKIECPYNCI